MEMENQLVRYILRIYLDSLRGVRIPANLKKNQLFDKKMDLTCANKN